MTLLETSCVLLSLNVPVAINCVPMPSGRVAVEGLIDNEVRLAANTLTCADADTEPYLARIVVCPTASGVTVPRLETVATLAPVTSQITIVVTSRCSPLLKVATAFIWPDTPIESASAPGETTRDLTIGAELPSPQPTANSKHKASTTTRATILSALKSRLPLGSIFRLLLFCD